jgi:hypothetical protein
MEFLSALKPKMKNHYRGHKMAVWLNLIPQLHQPGDDVSMRHHQFREKGDTYYAGEYLLRMSIRLKSNKANNPRYNRSKLISYND